MKTFANGERISHTVTAARAVPLPAGGAMLIGGLAAFAGLRKAKRA